MAATKRSDEIKRPPRSVDAPFLGSYVLARLMRADPY